MKEINYRINRKYYLLEELNHPESTTKFYLAKDEELGRNVGIKVFPLKGNYRNIKNEAKTSIQLRQSSPFIPEIYEVYPDFKNNLVYIVFQFISKNNLRSLMKPNGISEKETIVTFKKIITILEAIAKNNNHLNHRDLKPENILVDSHKNIYIIDFGLTFTPPLFGEGTHTYQAPEQAGFHQDRFHSFVRVDQFALGIMICEFLLGTPPLLGFDYYTDTTIPKEEWPLIEKLKEKKVSPKMIHFVLKLLSPKPNDRFINMSELKREFNKI